MKIVFEGWEVGMRPISFIKLLTNECGLSLEQAKRSKDRLVEFNQSFEIVINNIEVANSIINEARKLKVICRMEE